MIVNRLSHFPLRVMLPANVFGMAGRNMTIGMLGQAPLDIAEVDLLRAAVALECQ